MVLKHVYDWLTWRLPTHQYINMGGKGITGITKDEWVNRNNAYYDISHRHWNTGRSESQKLNPGEPTNRVRVTGNVCDNYCYFHMLRKCKSLNIKLSRITFLCFSMDDVKASIFHVPNMCMQCKVGMEAKF